jgi:hypothetical protein
MKAMTTLFLSLALSGCALFQTKPEGVPAFDAGHKQLKIDEKYLQDCAELAKLPGPTDEKVIASTKGWLDAYQECKTWKRELNRAVRDAFNLKEAK